MVILFEGRDAAGKGGTIKRFMEHLNPRGARVVALEKPTELERGQWYFQRYVQHLPTARRDRAVRPQLVQPRRRRARDGLLHRRTSTTSSCARRPSSSAIWCAAASHLIKFWFSVSRDEQRRRFKERKAHPLKQWKLSPDRHGLAWTSGTTTPGPRRRCSSHTDTADAPWTVIKSDCKKRARLNAMRYVLHKLPYANKDTQRIGNLDPLIVGRANVVVRARRAPGGADSLISRRRRRRSRWR